MKKTKHLLALLLLVTVCSSMAMAQPPVSGSLSGTLGPGEYIVVGNCTVDAGNTLTIEPGTTFLFSGHFNIKVYGTLHAVGTEQDSIVFISQSTGWDYEWCGIHFTSGSSPNSILSYAYLENARWIMYPDYYGGALQVDVSGVTISHCWIKNNKSSDGGGLYVNNATITISDCVFFGNEAGNGGGLYINNSTGVQVNNCIFAKNSSTST